MVASLQKQLIASPSEGFLDFPFISFYVGDIGIRMARNAVEIAEFAIGNTYIGSIYISVYLPCHFPMRYLLFTQFICNKHQFGQWSLMKKVHSLLNGKKLKI